MHSYIMSEILRLPKKQKRGLPTMLLYVMTGYSNEGSVVFHTEYKLHTIPCDVLMRHFKKPSANKTPEKKGKKRKNRKNKKRKGDKIVKEYKLRKIMSDVYNIFFSSQLSFICESSSFTIIVQIYLIFENMLFFSIRYLHYLSILYLIPSQ